MRFFLVALLLLPLVLAAGSAARADSWPNAVAMGVASRDGRTVVRVQPGTSIGDTLGFAGAGKGPYAQASYYRLDGDDKFSRYQAITLLNPVAPVFIAVSNAGELVTLDNWHNMGYGAVVVVYGPDGKIRRSHTLADLYSPEEINRFQRSTSSVWWRCPEEPALDARTTLMNVRDKLGNVLAVDMKTGHVMKNGKHHGC
jgi:hypothetical protein